MRWGIRRLVRQRDDEERVRIATDRSGELAGWVGEMRAAPIAFATEEANEQHYEVPAGFYRGCLGPRLKYSSAYYADATTTLAEAEDAMLLRTCEHADLEDGLRILELGCGWGSLTLWMAEKYPGAQITAVSNSASQRAHIEKQLGERGFSNVQVITADMNEFTPPTSEAFDRIVSVEMFEHMRNWEALLGRAHSWMKPAGKMFLHVFSHRQYFYPYETEGDDNWMAQHFFTGGMMPCHDLLEHLDTPFRVVKTTAINGMHYARTAMDWHTNLYRNREPIMAELRATYGDREAKRWFQRWSLFFLACHELFAHEEGNSWQVAHHLLEA